jgi:enediyne core biosynthesis thioesterase
MQAYEYVHTVGFEDTNLVGNVYFARYVSWQGRCRELFLRDHAPTVLDELARDLRLVTTHVSCDYFAELRALDRVVVRMTLAQITPGRVSMRFDYVRDQELVARGSQEIACLRAVDGAYIPAPVPEPLRAALTPYEQGLPA